MPHPQIIITLQTQLTHCLEKLWRVFNWCSSVLISITGAVLAAAASENFRLTTPGRILISVVAIIVTIYARAWIAENIRDEMDRIFEKELQYPQLKSLRPDKARFGYKAVIVMPEWRHFLHPGQV